MLICIIQSRSTSSRLPNKALLEIGGKPVIERVVNRIKSINLLKPGLIDEIVVAMPTFDPVVAWCKKNKVCFWEGSENNVLERYYEAASAFKADYVLRITADCPFIDPVLIIGLLTVKPRYSYQALAVNRGGIIDGQDAELFSFDELERVYKTANSCYDTEHVSPMMRKVDEDRWDYGTPFDFRGLKLSLDTPEDLERLKKYSELIC